MTLVSLASEVAVPAIKLLAVPLLAWIGVQVTQWIKAHADKLAAEADAHAANAANSYTQEFYNDFGGLVKISQHIAATAVDDAIHIAQTVDMMGKTPTEIGKTALDQFLSVAKTDLLPQLKEALSLTEEGALNYVRGLVHSAVAAKVAAKGVK